MAMRRPRLKAAVNLAPRRSATAVGPRLDPSPTVVQPKDEPHVDPVPEPQSVTSSTPPDEINTDLKDVSEAIPIEPVKSSAPPRRLIKPPVCLPLRKRKVPSTDIESQKDIPTPIVQSTSLPLDPQLPENEIPSKTPSSPLPPTTSTAPQFKPPFLSPSMQNVQNQKRADLVVHNPFANSVNDENRPGDLSDDAISAGGLAMNSSRLPPQSPNKVRQRIRPTPCFGHHRRNSMSQVS